MSAKSVLRTLTPKEIAALTKSAPRKFNRRSIERVSRDGLLIPSFAQQRLWFLAQMKGVSEAYHIPFGLRLKGDLNEAALVGALERIVARHEALRTVFYARDGELYQEIKPWDGSYCVERVDLRDNPSALGARVKEEALAPFDLEHGPLIRICLFRVGEKERVLLVTMHHIVSDGWSMGVLTRELSTLYKAHLLGEADPLAPLPIQYADYAAWQRQWLSGDVLAEQSSYWQGQLLATPALLELPTDRRRPAEQDFGGDSVRVELDEKLTSELKALSQRHGLTLFMTVLAGWSLVLSRLSNQEDLVIGTPSANRDRLEIEGLIGFFVNTLALRIDLSGAPTVRELLERVKDVALEAQTHQDLPFEQVVDLVKPIRSLSHTPLFQVMFTWQNYAGGIPELPGLQVEWTVRGAQPAKFDLELELWEVGGRIVGRLNYATTLFDRVRVERYASYLRAALSGMVLDLEQPAASVPLLSSDERHKLVVEWNATETAYPEDLCIQELFERQVEINPAATAVVYEDQSLTYGDLNVRANRLAHHLLSLGAKPDSRIAICVERSLEMVVGLLAILKSGAAYVPLDPNYPAERLSYMLQDSTPVLVLTHEAARSSLEAALALSTQSLPILDLQADQDDWAIQPKNNPDPKTIGLTSRNLAYVIYTSGSTGQPKGVMVEHKGVVNYLSALSLLFEVGEKDRVGALTTISFDISITDIFYPLVKGAVVDIIKSNISKQPEQLAQFIESRHISALQATPSTWKMLGTVLKASELKVLVGGETLSSDLAAGLGQKFRHLRNMYGPTETTIWSLSASLQNDVNASAPPIGRPISNTRIYLLDGLGNVVPEGVAGEIYIGGAGVARGYLNRPDLTKERFIDSPFVAGDRLYRTGDLGRYLSDGNIEFLGRNDFQVKIRGFRIELGEIEAKLSSHPLVRESVVLAREDVSGDKRLIGYYTLATEVDPGAEEFRTYLSGSLPEYMVPAAYVRLDALPLTANGKLDRKGLPAPGEDAYSHKVYEPPIGAIETALAEIWSEVLGVERVGRNDHFFDLGGHSLLAIRVLERMRQNFHVDLPARIMFENIVLFKLSEHVRDLQIVGGNLPTDTASPMVQMRTGTGAPLFLIHPFGGGLFGYKELVNSLSGNVPVYGIHAYAPELTNATTIDAIATIYLGHILHTQPHGPIRILGYSFGATIANMVARKLIENGRIVSKLIFIDMPALEPITFAGSSKEKWNYFAELYVGKNDIPFDTGTEKFIPLLEVINKRTKHEFSLSFLRASYSVFRRHLQASNTHVPFSGVYSEQVILYKPTLSVIHGPGAVNTFKRRWSNSEIVEVEANHGSIMATPAITTIGKDLNSRLIFD